MEVMCKLILFYTLGATEFIQPLYFMVKLTFLFCSFWTNDETVQLLSEGLQFNLKISKNRIELLEDLEQYKKEHCINKT